MPGPTDPPTATRRTNLAMLADVQPAPPDPILGLTEAFRADPRDGKVNLGVGVYCDEHGKTPVLDAVRQAERVLAETQTTKSYLPIDGDPGYHQAVRDLLLGPERDAQLGDRVRVCATPGGTGGLRVAGDLIHAAFPDARLWLSTPTWPNHPAVFAAAGLTTRNYRYFDAGSNALDFDGMMADLEQAADGDAILLHGCCHNPTGVDPSPDQWAAIAAFLANRRVLPVIDLAYQGFGTGLDDDAAGVHAVLDACPDALVVCSYSKNFSLYRERAGAVVLMAESADAARDAMSRMKQGVRRIYSNPPAHGGDIVRTILKTPALRDQWTAELDAMRSRINDTRAGLTRGLDERGVALSPDGNAFIDRQSGMFTLTGLTKDQVRALRERHAIYAVDSGRINVAGITPDRLDAVCEAIGDAVGNG
ncbi:MAG: amino acid aminotransferase [Planctomycetota bacterium]